jgi:hypothetical protein
MMQSVSLKQNPISDCLKKTTLYIKQNRVNDISKGVYNPVLVIRDVKDFIYLEAHREQL